MDEGIDLASNNSRPLEQPKVAMLVERPFSTYTCGQIYYLFDWETQLPVERIRTSIFEPTAVPKFGARYGYANLKDYESLAFGINVESDSQYSYDGLDKFPAFINPLLRYTLFRRGPFTSNIAEGGAFFKTNPDLPAADFQILFAPATFIKHGRMKLGKCVKQNMGMY